MTIVDLLENNAKLYPNEECLVELNPQIVPEQYKTWREYSLVEPTSATEYRRSITWKEFDDTANKFANLLKDKGIVRGNKVAILLMNSLEWLPIYFGILKLGALAVPMNYRYTSDEIKYCLDLADCNALVFGPEFIGRVEPIADHTPLVKTLIFVGDAYVPFADHYNQIINNYPAKKQDIKLDEEDEAAIYFSSGTTGFPKAILHLHKALISSCKWEQKHHGQQHNDIFLCIPPLYHTGAKMHWFGSLISSSKAVILKGIKPEWIMSAISEEKCTIVWLLVPWAQDILDAIDRGDIDLKKFNTDQLRLMHIGAQPVPPSLVQRWLKVFPNQQYDTNYGLSESIGPGCVHLGVENTDHVGAIGVPGYMWEVKIMDGDKEVTEPEEVGELCVKGPGVMVCYYKNKEATDEVLKDGWLYTGDMAKRDKDGFIYLVDRKKDVIITGGENLYPVQIEDFIRKHDKVKDVAVIGLPDERLGEIAFAIVEPKDGMELTVEEIEQFTFDLPRYKRPRKIVIAKVPRNATGKIEKPKLREKYIGKSLVQIQIEK
ncbi:MAG: acyl--CoA ligase [Acholeplasmatales bacterium]|nr:acyl--CoA ligase [Acholeplasmatales bacterium]